MKMKAKTLLALVLVSMLIVGTFAGSGSEEDSKEDSKEDSNESKESGSKSKDRCESKSSGSKESAESKNASEEDSGDDSGSSEEIEIEPQCPHPDYMARHACPGCTEDRDPLEFSRSFRRENPEIDSGLNRVVIGSQRSLKFRWDGNECMSREPRRIEHCDLNPGGTCRTEGYHCKTWHEKTTGRFTDSACTYGCTIQDPADWPANPAIMTRAASGDLILPEDHNTLFFDENEVINFSCFNGEVVVSTNPTFSGTPSNFLRQVVSRFC